MTPTLLALEGEELVFADGGKLAIPRGVGAKSDSRGVRLLKWVKPPGQRHTVCRVRVLAVGSSRDEVDAALRELLALSR